MGPAHSLYTLAVQKPLCNVLRAAFTLAWWAIIMMINTSSQSDAVNRTIDIILKLWACITLFMTANLLKTLLAKMMALKFNKESHLIKMTEALTKVSMRSGGKA